MKLKAAVPTTLLVVQAATAQKYNYTFTEEQKQNANRNLSIGFIVYHGFEILDVFGPLGIINDASWPYNMTLSVIAESTGPIHTRPPLHHGSDGMVMDMTGMIDTQIVATHTFATAPPLDVLLVPGGIGDLHLRERGDRQAEDFIAARFASTRYVLSVCTGAGFLARAGVLDGRRATATKGSWDWVTQFGSNVTWVPSARWVRDGKVWTSSGVTAGMDMIVAFLRQIYGDPEINTVVNNVEYIPHLDSSWDPFSVLHKVPGANMSTPMESLSGPLKSYT